MQTIRIMQLCHVDFHSLTIIATYRFALCMTIYAENPLWGRTFLLKSFTDAVGKPQYSHFPRSMGKANDSSSSPQGLGSARCDQLIQFSIYKSIKI